MLSIWFYQNFTIKCLTDEEGALLDDRLEKDKAKAAKQRLDVSY
jgi:hypothetical protein